VLLSWENEAMLARQQLVEGEFEIVTPSESILAEPPVAVVDRVVDRHGTREVATAYLAFLSTDEGQELAAKHYFRPRRAAAAAAYAALFPVLPLFTSDVGAGGGARAQATHFADGGVFDQIYRPK
jgi:ABC-type sulfate transport system substrate-binding protein